VLRLFFSLGKNEMMGDLLCVIAATAYSVILVSQEHLIKVGSAAEYLGMIGMFGMLVSSAQM